MAFRLSLIRRTLTRIAIPIGEKSLVLESGQLARMADGCAVGHLGHTSVMVAAVSADRPPPPGQDFLPLTVDYRQKAAAAGRIPTNFLRRELGMSDHEILTSRMIDRSIRAVFPPEFMSETQVACNLLAVDGVHDPEVLCINAASMALALSPIPWNGPVGAVRVGCNDGTLILNPTRQQLSKSSLNLVLTGMTGKRVVMMEMSGDGVNQDVLFKAISVGLEAVDRICSEIASLSGKTKRETPSPVQSEQSFLLDATKLLAEKKLKEIFLDASHDKQSRDRASRAVGAATVAELAQAFREETKQSLDKAFSIVNKETIRRLILEEDRRCDGRGLQDLRPIDCKVDLYQPLHGSALFQRGQTQVLCTVAFDSPDSVFRSDRVSALMGAMPEKRFFLHYEFPRYSTNEVSTMRTIGRRELGHGALAEKAIRPIVPADFPFTIRLTSEVLESNGSSSMASVCGGSLALMDAGVQTKAAVAGVAMGLVTDMDANGRIKDFRILSDISGIEDYAGDMDLKVAGTADSFTAVQLDVKIPGLPSNILMQALQQSISAKKRILDIMNASQPAPRPQLKKCGPVMELMPVKPEERALIIGHGGVHLKKIQGQVGVQLSMDDRSLSIFAPNADAMQEAKEALEALRTRVLDGVELEFGAVYSVQIVEIRDSGVMVKIHPNMSPVLLHNSQLDAKKISHPSVLGLEVGQQLKVKYFGRDPADGRVRLSRKVLLAPATPGTRYLTRSGEITNPNQSPWSS